MKEKIAFLVSGKKIVENIKKYLDDDEILVVETSLNNSVEEAKKMVENGVKIILTKLAIKMKIEEEIDVPILCIENNISDYIELLSEINIKNKKVAFVDYIEYPVSLISLSKMISENIVFKNFSSEEECEKIVEDLKRKNYEILIGNVLTQRYANKYGLLSCEVSISEDSVQMYIELARQMLESLEIQSLKRKVLSNIENLINNYLETEGKLERNVLDKVQMNDVERDKLIDGLKKNGFSLTKTAESLGMSRTTLWRKLKKFNITIE